MLEFQLIKMFEKIYLIGSRLWISQPTHVAEEEIRPHIGPGFLAQSFQNPWNFLSEKGERSISVTPSKPFRRYLNLHEGGNSRRWLVTRGKTTCSEVWHLQPHPTTNLWGKQRGWTWSSINNCQQFNQLSQCHETAMKNTK